MARGTKVIPDVSEAASDAPALETAGVEGPVEEEVEAFSLTVEALIHAGYVGAGEAKDFMCVLGRRAVAPSHSCMGMNCMAWRSAPVAGDATNQRYGYCGLAGKP